MEGRAKSINERHFSFNIFKLFCIYTLACTHMVPLANSHQYWNNMHRTAVIRCALFHSQRILFNSPNAIKFSSIYTPQLPIYTFYIYICNPPTMSFYYMWNRVVSVLWICVFYIYFYFFSKKYYVLASLDFVGGRNAVCVLTSHVSSI